MRWILFSIKTMHNLWFSTDFQFMISIHLCCHLHKFVLFIHIKYSSYNSYNGIIVIIIDLFMLYFINMYLNFFFIVRRLDHSILFFTLLLLHGMVVC